MKSLRHGALVLLMLLALCTQFPVHAHAYAGLPTPPVQGNDDPIVGDFNGDSYVDPTIVRNDGTNLTWYIHGVTNITYGINGDIPVPGYYSQYTNDVYYNREDIAVWRPSNGTWYIRAWDTGATTSIQFGQIGDYPIPGYYPSTTGQQALTGIDLPDTLAVFRPSDGTTFVRHGYQYTYLDNTSPVTAPFMTFPYENEQNLAYCAPPVCAQQPYANPAFYTTDPQIPPNNDENTQCTDSQIVSQPLLCQEGPYYGVTGDEAYDQQFGTTNGCGILGNEVTSSADSMSIWRPSNGTWSIHNPVSPLGLRDTYTLATIQFGQAGDIPVPGHYYGSLSPSSGCTLSNWWTDQAVWRPTTGIWYIRGGTNLTWGNPW